MFAFAVWDKRTRTLTLARDRFGVKPLYDALLPDGTLVFGSEMKAIIARGHHAEDFGPQLLVGSELLEDVVVDEPVADRQHPIDRPLEWAPQGSHHHLG